MNNQDKAKRPSIVLIVSSVLLALVLIVGGLYIFRFAGLSEDQFNAHPFSPPDTLEVPMRPGVQGVVISGPPLRDLIFKIDLRAAGIQPVNWGQLEGMAPASQLVIQAQVSKSGDLIINHENDVHDGGFPKAGEYLAGKISTWKYEPHKTGWIRFKFSPGAPDHLLTVDASDLKKNVDIPAKIRVRNGIMYYVNGLQSAQVGVGHVSF